MSRAYVCLGLLAVAVSAAAAAQQNPPPAPSVCEPAVIETSDLLGAVLFEDGSAALGTTARTALSALLEAAKAAGYTRVIVVGHTDEAGTPQENLALGGRRASAAVTLLSPSAGAIALEPMSCGESLLAIKASGRRHPHNRRVELRGGR